VDGFATGRALALGNGLAALAFGAGLRAATFFFAAGLAALDFGLAAGFFAFGRAGRFGAAFLRTGFADFRAFAPAGFRAGLRGFDLAGNLRAGFAGFLAMVILENRLPYVLSWGRTGKPQILSCC
jgi:hypothetical protein